MQHVQHCRCRRAESVYTSVNKQYTELDTMHKVIKGLLIDYGGRGQASMMRSKAKGLFIYHGNFGEGSGGAAKD